MNKFKQSTAKKLYIVCDIDDVIVHQTPKWCKNLYEEYKDDPIMNKYLVLDESLCDYKTVLSRSEYYLLPWLAKPDMDVKTIPKEIHEAIMDVTNEDETFYDDLEPTKMGYALQTLCYTPKVAKIYFVSKGDDNPAWQSKLRFINKYFNFGDKSEIIRVPLDCKKSDYINKYIPDKSKINAIFEDQGSNIIDILDNSLQDNEEVVVYYPDVGYGLHTMLLNGQFSIEKLEEYDNNCRDIQVYALTD